MNVYCPNCQTLFRVDPDRVPPDGARVRCSRCPAVFLLTRQGGRAVSGALATAPLDGVRAPGGPARSPHAAPAPPAAARPTPPPDARTVPAAATAAATPVAPAAPRAAPAAPRAASPAGAPPRRTSFAAQDPNARAQRIARALVSDIVAYHPDRRERSLASGTLRVEFREEIMKSWEEYVAQVGMEMAKKTPYFRAALNEILAKGQAIF